jgi:hypothetical protein
MVCGSACRCPPGQEGRGTGLTECQPCPLGAFREADMGVCSECPVNSATAGLGASSRSACVCIAGYFAQWNSSDAAASSGVSRELCTACPKEGVRCNASGALTTLSPTGLEGQ